MLKQRRTLKGHLGKITSLAWSADSANILSAGQDGKLILWEAQSTNKLQAVKLQSTWVMTCSLSPSGKFAASGGLDNICSLYDLKAVDAAMSRNPAAAGEVPPTKSMDAHVGFVSGIKFLSDQELLTCSGDGTCGLWDIGRGAMTTQYTGHGKDVMGLTLLRDGSGHANTFVSASGDKTARLWDIRSGRAELLFNVAGKDADLMCIDAFPDSRAFATGGEDATVRLFDIRSEVQLQTYIPSEEASKPSDEKRKVVTSLSFTQSGRALAVGYEDEVMRVWDTLRGEQITVIKAHDERVTCVAVSPDGSALASGSWDKIIKVWA